MTLAVCSVTVVLWCIVTQNFINFTLNVCPRMLIYMKTSTMLLKYTAWQYKKGNMNKFLSYYTILGTVGCFLTPEQSRNTKKIMDDELMTTVNTFWSLSANKIQQNELITWNATLPIRGILQRLTYMLFT